MVHLQTFAKHALTKTINTVGRFGALWIIYLSTYNSMNNKSVPPKKRRGITGYEQVRSVVAAFVGDWEAARDVQFNLPKTGVCSSILREMVEPVAVHQTARTV